MAFKIYSKHGDLRVALSPTDSSTQQEALQGGDTVSLSATHCACTVLEVDDYAEFCGRRYMVAERYAPRQKSAGEWAYSVQLYSPGSLIGRYLVQDRTDGGHETVFSLTAPPREHMAMIVRCINEATGTDDWKVGSVDGSDNITIDYEGTYCDEALSQLAKKCDTEYWIDGTTVNLCRCEHGEVVTLGYHNGLTAIEQGKASNVKFFTRLHPSGSSRNINPETYGSSRLRLPGGADFIERGVEEFGVIDHFESAAFSHIYPHRTGRVGNVRTAERRNSDGSSYTVYYFTDPGLDFDPNDYEIPALVKRVSFTEGAELSGMGREEGPDYFFEVNYDSRTGEFEIVTIWPDSMNGAQLPGGVFIPKEGDGYILWNIRMPQEYIEDAEKELATAAEAFMDENRKDVSVYKAKTDHVEMAARGEFLTLGRRIRLVSPERFPSTGERLSRLTKITRKLNNPAEMDLEISDVTGRSLLSVINDNIQDAVSRIKSGMGALPDIIRTGDRTPWTDNNLLSALRSLQEFLSKKDNDTAAGLITFLKGLVSNAVARLKGGAEFGEFVSGMMTGIGAAIDSRGNAEFESVTARSALRVMELIINRLGAQEGDTLFSESDTIDSCTLNPDGTYLLKVQEKYDGYFTAMTAGMVLKGTVNTLGKGGTDYYTSFMRVNSVNASANTIEVSLYPDDEVPAGKNHPPCGLMRAVRWGHQTDKSKQSLFYISSTEGRIIKLSGVDRPIIGLGNYEATFGTLPEKLSELLPIAPGESGIYVKHMVTEAVWQLDHQGKPLPTVRDRGPYDPDEFYYSGDTLRPETNDWEHSDVWHNGCRWRCMATDTKTAPAYNITAWSFMEGDPTFRVELRGGPASIRPRSFKFTLEVVASIYNEDVTDTIADGDIEWTRYTEDDDGNRRADSDNVWAMRHAQAGRSLTLTEADLDITAGIVPKVAVFTATVRLRPGTTPKTASYGYRA